MHNTEIWAYSLKNDVIWLCSAGITYWVSHAVFMFQGLEGGSVEAKKDRLSGSSSMNQILPGHKQNW